MTATPTYKQTTEALWRVTFLANELDDAVRWSKMIGHHKAITGEGGGRGTNTDTVGGIVTAGIREKAPAGSEPRGLAGARSETKAAWRDILRALVLLESAMNRISRAQAFADEPRNHPDEPPPPGFQPITQGELRAATRAKGRRTGRGEGWGAS